MIARKLGITHMVDDHDDALKDVYLAQSESGTIFHYVGNCSMSPVLENRAVNFPKGISAINSREEQYFWATVYSIRITRQQPLQA